MKKQEPIPVETMECPLCLGEGKLKRTEVLDRLGVKDFARVAQLSAEEAFRLLQQKHNGDGQNAWARFEAELAERVGEAEQRHNDELRTLAGRIKELESAAKLAEQQNAVNVQRVRAELEGRLRSEQSQKEDLTRRVEGYFTEISQLRERNRQLEAEMAKVARVGRREEIDFAEEARTWPGIHVSEKLSRNGDYILAYRDPSGAALEPRMLVDNKDKSVIAEGDILSVLLALAGHADENGECNPSVPRLASMTGLSERQTIRVLHQLREKRLIAFKDNSGGRGKTTTYRLLVALGKGDVEGKRKEIKGTVADFTVRSSSTGLKPEDQRKPGKTKKGDFDLSGRGKDE